MTNETTAPIAETVLPADADAAPEKNEIPNENEPAGGTGSDDESLERAAEAVLFASGSAVGFLRLAGAIGLADADADELNAAARGAVLRVLDRLKKRYEACGSAIELILYDDGAQLATRAEYAQTVRTALSLRHNQPLSKAALEVLAIVAFHQPVTRALIDKVRGVESPAVTAALCEKGLIEEVGRLDAPGHPILYGTTSVFLRTFGLSSAAELAALPELAEIRRLLDESASGSVSDTSDRAVEPSETPASPANESEAEAKAEIETEVTAEAEAESEQ